MMLHSLNLDFRPPRAAWRWSGATLLLSGAALALGTISHYRSLVGQLEAEERVAESNTHPAGRNRVKTQPSNEQALADQVKHAREVLAQLALPWNRLFEAVETSVGDDVALLAIEPDAAHGQIRVVAEARNLDAVLDFTRRLSEQKALSKVALQSHQIQEQDAQQPVRFTVVARWNPSP